MARTRCGHGVDIAVSGHRSGQRCGAAGYSIMWLSCLQKEGKRRKKKALFGCLILTTFSFVLLSITEVTEATDATETTRMFLWYCAHNRRYERRLFPSTSVLSAPTNEKDTKKRNEQRSHFACFS